MGCDEQEIEVKNTHLIGKAIKEIQMTTDKLAIKFVLEDGAEVIARTDADCCSQTWIEHISLPCSGFPAFVTDARNIEMPDLGTPDNAECVAYYGYEIKTNKGDLVIDYRNESNGYYGGYLYWPGDNFCGGVYGQNIANDEFVPVTHDI